MSAVVVLFVVEVEITKSGTLESAAVEVAEMEKIPNGEVEPSPSLPADEVKVEGARPVPRESVVPGRETATEVVGDRDCTPLNVESSQDLPTKDSALSSESTPERFDRPAPVKSVNDSRLRLKAPPEIVRPFEEERPAVLMPPRNVDVAVPCDSIVPPNTDEVAEPKPVT